MLFDVALVDGDETGEDADAAVEEGLVDGLLVEEAVEDDEEVVDVELDEVEVLDAVEDRSSLKMEFPNTIACEMSSLVASVVCRALRAAWTSVGACVIVGSLYAAAMVIRAES